MVKCAECGYLAVRHLETRELREAEGTYRDTGEIPRDLNRPKHLYAEVPLCFEHLRIFDPHQCASATGRQGVLQAEIGPCVGFTKWDLGFTPKEHREMLDRQRLLEWQAEREDDDRKWHAKQREEDNRIRRLELWTAVIIAGGFTVVGATIGAVLTAILTR